MPNRLVDQASPYLRQHATNPVDWWPWSEQAFAEARRRNVLVMLSCGYSACHWCHVMERESFADDVTAGLINADFVAIKVDREERPDIDQVYQAAVQSLTGQGGWPLTVFLTPAGEPVWGGTYFPPHPSHGRPSFQQVLRTMAAAWREKPENLSEAAGELVRSLAGEAKAPAMQPTEALIAEAARAMADRIDRRYGGFGHAPKFPNVSNLLFLLRHGRLHREPEYVELALLTLRQMARGGIHDHLGGGFHRYATDDRWLVPHFEKMLYDNAQLLPAYTAAYQITRDEEFAAVARGIVEYVRQEMTAPPGGFYATQDADTEGVEGGFFLWTRQEVREALGDEDLYALAERAYGLAEPGDFAGRNILHRSMGVEEIADSLGRPAAQVRIELERVRQALLAAREKRVRPLRDEKIVLGWNGLMLSGLAQAAQALDDRVPLDLAQRAADFILHAMAAGPAHLFRIHQDGAARIPAFLDDYAFLVAGLIDLYESDFNPRWLDAALRLQETVFMDFKADDARYTLNSTRGERLVAPAFSGYDQAVPSGVGMHCQNLIRLHGLTGEDRFEREAREILAAHAGEMRGYPLGYGTLLCALEMDIRRPTLVVIAGLEGSGRDTLRRLREAFIPYRVVAARRNGDGNIATHPAAHLLLDRPVIGGETTFYVCAGSTCHPPQIDWRGVEQLLN